MVRIIRIISITINLTIYVFVQIYAKKWSFIVTCVLYFCSNSQCNGFVQLPIHDFNNRTFWTFLLVNLRKIQYARDDERPHFCINLNNIDNEVYCDFIVMLTSFQTISSINYADTADVAQQTTKCLSDYSVLFGCKSTQFTIMCRSYDYDRLPM
jgi:hypothetical protein